MKRTLLMLCATVHGSNVDLPLLDGALAAIAAARNALTAAAEETAVRRILQGDEHLLLLAKHFGYMPSFAQLLNNAVGHQSATTVEPSLAAAAAGVKPSPSPVNVLTLRRSVKEYDSRPVPPDSIRRALDAAILAPNHFLTEPWRFYELGPTARQAIGALNPAKQEVFAKVPGWMMVTVAASEYAADGSLSTKKGLEDHAATACAVQNFMLSLAAEGLGTKWMTGALGIVPEKLMDLAGVNATAERFMGMVWYGYPQTQLESLTAPARKLGVEGVYKVLA